VWLAPHMAPPYEELQKAFVDECNCVISWKASELVEILNLARGSIMV